MWIIVENDMTDDYVNILMDEEGKLKGKPFNHEATEVWFPDEGILPDTIVGDAVVLTKKGLMK